MRGLWPGGAPHPQTTCFAILAAETLGCLPEINARHGPALRRIVSELDRDADGLPLLPELRRQDLTSPSHSASYIRLQTQYFLLHASDALGAPIVLPQGLLKKLSDRGYLLGWLDAGPWNNPWLHSNNIMFVSTFLQFWWSETRADVARQRFDDVLDYLEARQDARSGLWQPNDGPDMFNAMCAAYHFWPYYFWRGRRPRYADAVIDATLGLQQTDGLFGQTAGGGACEDLDAIHTLIMMSLVTTHRAPDVETALARALQALLVGQHADGGFSNYFVREPSKSWKRRAGEAIGLDRLLDRPMQIREWHQSGWSRLGCPVTQSDTWAAWFRPLAIRLISDRYHLTEGTGRPGTFRTQPGLGWHDAGRISASRELVKAMGVSTR